MTISGCFVVASSQPFLAKKILQTNKELDLTIPAFRCQQRNTQSTTNCSQRRKRSGRPIYINQVLDCKTLVTRYDEENMHNDNNRLIEN